MKKIIALILISGSAFAGQMDDYQNPFWFDEFGAPLKKTFADFATHNSFDNNVLLKWDADCQLTDVFTWPVAYDWQVTPYENMSTYIGDGCWAGQLGVVKDGDDYVLDGDNVIFE